MITIRKKASPQPGDIVKVNRGLYTHYGIYAGDGRVIHFAPPSGAHGMEELDPTKADICETDIDAFAGEGHVVVDDHSIARFTREEIVDRARGCIGSQLGTYNLIEWNCEHFARWCVTGEKRSRQVNQVTNAITNTVKILKTYEEKGPVAAMNEFINRQREPEKC